MNPQSPKCPNPNCKDGEVTQYSGGKPYSRPCVDCQAPKQATEKEKDSSMTQATAESESHMVGNNAVEPPTPTQGAGPYKAGDKISSHALGLGGVDYGYQLSEVQAAIANYAAGTASSPPDGLREAAKELLADSFPFKERMDNLAAALNNTPSPSPESGGDGKNAFSLHCEHGEIGYRCVKCAEGRGDCTTCFGTGEDQSFHGGPLSPTKPCLMCNGTGKEPMAVTPDTEHSEAGLGVVELACKIREIEAAILNVYDEPDKVRGSARRLGLLAAKLAPNDLTTKDGSPLPCGSENADHRESQNPIPKGSE